eukprot:1812941-Pyramimonas_sp.AAC.1
MATGAIYGARDAGRQWYLYAQKVFADHGLVESKLETASTTSTTMVGSPRWSTHMWATSLSPSATTPPSGRPLSHRWGRSCTSSQSKGSSSTADVRLPSSTTSSA